MKLKIPETGSDTHFCKQQCKFLYMSRLVYALSSYMSGLVLRNDYTKKAEPSSRGGRGQSNGQDGVPYQLKLHRLFSSKVFITSSISFMAGNVIT